MLDEALGIYRDLLPKWKEIGHRPALAHELECIAFIMIKKEELEQATTLLGAAQALRELIDSNMTKVEEVEYQKEITSLRASVAQSEFEQAWNRGRGLTMDQAIELAVTG